MVLALTAGGWYGSSPFFHQLPAGPVSASDRDPSRSLNEHFSRQIELGMTSGRASCGAFYLRTSLKALYYKPDFALQILNQFLTLLNAVSTWRFSG